MAGTQSNSLPKNGVHDGHSRAAMRDLSIDCKNIRGFDMNASDVLESTYPFDRHPATMASSNHRMANEMRNLRLALLYDS